MKLVKQFMKSVGASRRKSGSSSPASRKRRATSTMKESSTSATEETSNRSLSSVCEAPWRVERIRVGAPGEADWWKEEEVTTDDTWLTSGGSSGVSGESLDESVEKEYGNKTSSNSDNSSGSTTTTTSNRKFHNCGLETWEAARAAWTARPVVDEFNSSQSTSNLTSSKSSSPVNQRELGKILTKASSLRTYELPRRTPLKNLVESYVMVWNGSDEL